VVDVRCIYYEKSQLRLFLGRNRIHWVYRRTAKQTRRHEERQSVHTPYLGGRGKRAVERRTYGLGITFESTLIIYRLGDGGARGVDRGLQYEIIQE